MEDLPGYDEWKTTPPAWWYGDDEDPRLDEMADCEAAIDAAERDARSLWRWQRTITDPVLLYVLRRGVRRLLAQRRHWRREHEELARARRSESGRY